MWSSVKRRVPLGAFLGALVLVLALAGCGFQPMYGGSKGAAVESHLAAIDVERIPDRMGQQLRNALEHRLFAGGRTQSIYRLKIVLEDRVEELGLRRDRTTSRANLRIKAQWTLHQGDAVLRRGATEAIAAYNILDYQYATVSSKKEAQSRAVEQLADEIVRQVSVYFSRAG